MKQKKQPVVIADLPGAGLGNILFIWARAKVFASLNNLPQHTLGWDKVKLGPLLRGEASKRIYSGFFQQQTSIIRGWRLGLQIRATPSGQIKRNPPANSKDDAQELSHLKFVLFDEIPHWGNYFEGIREHRELVKVSLHEMLRPALKKRLEQCEPPVIGVHVRLGDFRALRENENFRETGGVRTPLQYFEAMIRRVREIRKADLPVTIFTDGRAGEIQPLLDMPNVKLAQKHPDIVEMLLLSRSRVIITSAGSTFGYWAGFLADAPLIMHPDHIHQNLRSREFNNRFFEGALLDDIPALLIENVRDIP